MTKSTLQQQLESLSAARYPLHMPGHKRRVPPAPGLGCYAWDLTEIDGADDLHDADGILADAMEAVFAAVYLDGGIDAANALIHRLLLDAEREEAVEERRRDYKTALQELVQRTPGTAVTYRLVEESGPDHCRVFVMEVSVGGEPAGRGEGRSKKEAEQAAAKAALEAMKQV